MIIGLTTVDGASFIVGNDEWEVESIERRNGIYLIKDFDGNEIHVFSDKVSWVRCRKND